MRMDTLMKKLSLNEPVNVCQSLELVPSFFFYNIYMLYVALKQNCHLRYFVFEFCMSIELYIKD